jgi:hypothetical protein
MIWGYPHFMKPPYNPNIKWRFLWISHETHIIKYPHKPGSPVLKEFSVATLLQGQGLGGSARQRQEATRELLRRSAECWKDIIVA